MVLRDKSTEENIRLTEIILFMRSVLSKKVVGSTAPNKLKYSFTSYLFVIDKKLYKRDVNA